MNTGGDISPNLPYPPGLTQDSYRTLALQCESQATYEELEGCIGLSELYWKKAVKICRDQFPKDILTARMIAGLGMFFGRILPLCEQGAEYLRESLEIERGITSEESVDVAFQLVKCLLNIDSCGEAERLLHRILQKDSSPETEITAKTFTARILFLRGDILQSEKMLREILSSDKVAKVIAAAKVCLSEVLFAKEFFEESEALLEEVLSLVEANFDEDHQQALRLLSSIYQKKGIEQINSKVKSIVLRLQSHNARPYAIAQVYTIVGESNSSYFGGYCREAYIQALKIYNSKSPSWYTTLILMKITDRYTSGRYEHIPRENFSRLPQSSALLALVNPTSIYTKIYQDRVSTLSENTLESHIQGAALVALLRLHPDTWIPGLRNKAEFYVFQHPSHKVTLQLRYALASFSEKGKEKAVKKLADLEVMISYYRSADISREKVAELLAELADAKRKCSPNRFGPVRNREALSHLQEAVSICTAAAPVSYAASKYRIKLAECQKALGFEQAADDNMYKSLSILREINPNHSTISLVIRGIRKNLDSSSEPGNKTDREDRLLRFADCCQQIYPDSVDTSRAVACLLRALLEKQKVAEAENYFSSYAYNCFQRDVCSSHAARVIGIGGYSRLLSMLPKMERLIERYVDICLEITPESSQAEEAISELFDCYQKQKRYEESESTLLRCANRYFSISQTSNYAAKVSEKLSDFYRTQKRYTEAEQWLLKYIDILLEIDQAKVASEFSALVSLYKQADKYATIEPLLLHYDEVCSQRFFKSGILVTVLKELLSLFQHTQQDEKALSILLRFMRSVFHLKYTSSTYSDALSSWFRYAIGKNDKKLIEAFLQKMQVALIDFGKVVSDMDFFTEMNKFYEDHKRFAESERLAIKKECSKSCSYSSEFKYSLRKCYCKRVLQPRVYYSDDDDYIDDDDYDGYYDEYLEDFNEHHYEPYTPDSDEMESEEMMEDDYR